MSIVYLRSTLPTDGPPGHEPSRSGLRCASCNDEIVHEPVIRDGKVYCCEGCAAGGPCIC